MALTPVRQLDPIYVDVTQSSAVRARLILDDNTRYALDGELAFSDVTVDQGTGTVTLRAIFPNPKHDLLPGMFVRADVG